MLLDVRMPDLDGPQTLDALRKLEPELPPCFMSGNTAPMSRKADPARRRVCYRQAVPPGRPGYHPPAAGAWRARRSDPVRQSMSEGITQEVRTPWWQRCLGELQGSFDNQAKQRDLQPPLEAPRNGKPERTYMEGTSHAGPHPTYRRRNRDRRRHPRDGRCCQGTACPSRNHGTVLGPRGTPGAATAYPESAVSPRAARNRQP